MVRKLNASLGLRSALGAGAWRSIVDWVKSAFWVSGGGSLRASSCASLFRQSKATCPLLKQKAQRINLLGHSRLEWQHA